jgi:hypothetical protein
VCSLQSRSRSEPRGPNSPFVASATAPDASQSCPACPALHPPNCTLLTPTIPTTRAAAPWQHAPLPSRIRERDFSKPSWLKQTRVPSRAQHFSQTVLRLLRLLYGVGMACAWPLLANLFVVLLPVDRTLFLLACLGAGHEEGVLAHALCGTAVWVWATAHGGSAGWSSPGWAPCRTRHTVHGIPYEADWGGWVRVHGLSGWMLVGWLCDSDSDPSSRHQQPSRDVSGRGARR